MRIPIHSSNGTHVAFCLCLRWSGSVVDCDVKMCLGKLVMTNVGVMHAYMIGQV